MNDKVVILAGKGESTDIIFNSLAKEFNIVKLIVEEPVDQFTFLKRRVKNLGILKVFGQILFKIFIVKYLGFVSKKRVAEIKEVFHLDSKPVASNLKAEVKSVNNDQTIKLLKEIQPAVIIVNGTRIISKKVLLSINVPFINTHAGITPLYRGVHGGYWALVNKDVRNCGVTVHLVDVGIDTGNILHQDVITVTPKDNFITYPYLQLAFGIPLLKQATKEALLLKLSVKENPNGKSQLWYHPTLVEYVYNWLKLGVK